ncbi:MAG TPA: glycosyltransferase family 4 protein [Chthoniobacteraceae bacterium]|jgi:glycosyltransferase involved in cell wall biosynthesis
MTPDDLRSARPVVFVNFWREGGMRHYSESLVHALAGATPVFYLRNYQGETGAPGLVLDLNFHPLRLRNWISVVRIARLLRELRPRAVHLNNEQPALLPLYPLLARMNSVITLHDARSHAGERLAKRLFHRLHLRLVRLFIRKVIVHSEAIRQALPSAFSRAEVHVMPHVNYQLWASGSAPPLPAPPLTVLFFGRILAYKGLDVLLEAFRRLDPARFRLLIAGEGELPPTNEPNIEVENCFITDDRIASFFHRAHVVAVPYRAASQSGVAHLAFAFGKPVIATQVGALPDLVRHEENGLLIPPEDPVALAAAIERLADASLRERFEQAIRRDNSSSDREIRERLLTIYDA